MFGYCVWLEVPSLQHYVNYYSHRNWGEHFQPHISIATHCTLEEAINIADDLNNVTPTILTLDKPYYTKTENFYALQCDIVECPDHHISIAYRYNIPWTDNDIKACNPPEKVKTGNISVWKCDGLVSVWRKNYSVTTPYRN